MDTHNRALLPAFHAGEILLQAKTGNAERMAELGTRVIRRSMPAQHRQFFQQLPYVIVGALDEEQQPWATILTGIPGFIRSPDDTTLEIAALARSHDPLAGTLHIGSPVGMLGLEAHTRRRNRVNGTVAAIHADSYTLRVFESFGNCPKYIQAREARHLAIGKESAPVQATTLDSEMAAIVAQADTFFIASAHPSAGNIYGADVSHRGGSRGFVRIETHQQGGSRLLVPDFVGNAFFNTLGNIALNPRVGLLFIDYAGHRLLHVAGRADIVFDSARISAYPGAERLLSITTDKLVLRHNALPLSWSDAEPSPFLAGTGPW